MTKTTDIRTPGSLGIEAAQLEHPNGFDPSLPNEEYYAASTAMTEMQKALAAAQQERCWELSRVDGSVEHEAATINMQQETARMERLLNEHERASAAFKLGQAEWDENNKQSS